MSYDSDPPRMSELGSGASPQLSSLFQNARRDVPNDSQLERVLTRLGPIVGAGVALAGDAVRAGAQQAAHAGSSSMATIAKLAAVIGGAGIIASGAAFLASGKDDQPSKPVQTAPSRTAQVAAAAAPEPPAEVAPSTSPAAESATQAPAAKTGRVEAASDSVKAEATLLEKARALVVSDPNKALALTREHARRFPRGVLAQEREVIGIEALRRLGRQTEADDRANHFREAYPGSAHQRALGSSASER